MFASSVQTQLKARMVTSALVLAHALAGAIALAFPSIAASPSAVKKYLSLGAAIGAVYILAFDSRNYFLPFLGPAAVPPTVLRIGTSLPPDAATVSVQVSAPPRATHVIFWAASTSALSPTKAYGSYENAGVAEVRGGSAALAVQCPGGYSVGGFKLRKHVHYRFVYPDGLLGEVKTVNVKC